MKKYFIPLIISGSMLFSCKEQKVKQGIKAINTIDRTWLDSVIKASDSSYSKPYKRTDFVTAYYYVNSKDSSICQVMKDVLDTIRQVIIARKNVRSYFAQYYANGQLQASLPLDESGQYNGNAVYYHEDGTKESEGQYTHGLKTGEWMNYNKEEKFLSTDRYNADGQIEKNNMLR